MEQNSHDSFMNGVMNGVIDEGEENPDLVSGQVELIREVFKYAKRFSSKRFVIQITSALIEHPLFPSLIQDIATLHQGGIRIILVAGAGRRIDAVLRQFNMEPEFAGGLRISREPMLPLIKMAAFDTANRMMSELSSHQVSSVIGNWVRARALGVVNGTDFHMTGTVERISAAQIERVLNDDIIPILPCIGWNNLGQAYNISSLELARHLASNLRAEKLFYITSAFRLSERDFRFREEGVVVNNGALTRMTAAGARNFLEDNTGRLDAVAGEIIVHATEAVSSGVERVHILNGSSDGVLLKETFSTKGSGVMIHADPFDAIRPMEEADVSQVLRLMTPGIEEGQLLPRGRQQLLEQRGDFVVYVTDGSVRGCGALHEYPGKLGEIAAMAVDPGYNHLGIGQKILRYLIQRSREQSLKQIFALTTRASDWFMSLGFRKGDLSHLPEEKRLSYNKGRNSRIFYLPVE
ncbi:amino-acid N-acetyltransferase [Salinispira pacifica]|uniref:amino-acid N-acetyltransferase n=1 Tax=Salinispira pacifica TaxID=1307761 RepID=V5WLT7_9SPIO|nr:amino-acid N-acetyltransferase [Salinispira pacifica]AHC16588.1 N-acetylglutamate synthase [Salinispira pacifica]